MKIKISRVGNPHIILGGVQEAAGAANNHKTEPLSYDCESREDNNTTCASQTNTGNDVRTTAAPMDMNNNASNFTRD